MNRAHDQSLQETALSAWRKSYHELRAVERQLVVAARNAEEPVKLDALYREIEQRRIATTDMFKVAQIESVSRHVTRFRTSFSLPAQEEFRFDTRAAGTDADESSGASGA